MNSLRTPRSYLSQSVRTTIPANRLAATPNLLERESLKSARNREIPAYRLAATPNLLERERLRRFYEYDNFMKAIERRRSPGFGTNQSSYNLEHDRLGATHSLQLADQGRMDLADLTVEEIDVLHENLQRRLTSLTRCISEFKKQQWSPNIEVFQSKLLEDTYRSESQITPPWFRALFLDGPRTFELVPTFPDDILVTSTEYQELSEARFKVTMSFIDSLMGIHGGLFISEKLSPSFKTNFDPRETTSSFYGIRQTNQSTVPVSTTIYSNHSGIVLQPINNNPSDWLTNYCYTVKPNMPIYKRRVVLSGKFNIEDAISSFEKLFRIIIILDENNEIKGIYRRQMTSENSFLTWKIIFT